MYFSLSRSIGDSNISLDRLRAAALRNFVLVSFEIILRFYLKIAGRVEGLLKQNFICHGWVLLCYGWARSASYIRAGALPVYSE